MYRDRKPFYGDQLRIIGSPEKLERDGNPGSDLTNTRRDLELLDVWGRKREILSYPATTTFDSKVKIAFHPLFEISHPTFLYYVGHGLDKEKASELHYSASPSLDELMERFVRYRDRPDYDPLFHVLDTLKEKCDGRKVKGGELFLHQFGFCDLYGLLKFWCAGVCDYVNVHDDCYPLLNLGKTWFPEDEERWVSEDEEQWFLEDEEPWVPNLFDSQLVVILDSCYSGEVAQQLHDFVSDIGEKVPRPPDGINITVQAACGTDERTVGGYFTPVFTYLNDPENEEVLEKWKDEWKKMTEEARSNYKSLDLPSPMVVTTLPARNDTTMKFTFQGNFGLYTNVTLFPDAGFFKFCFVKVHRHQDKTLFEGQDRVLNDKLVTRFMRGRQFNVIDYKLKIMGGSPGPDRPYAGNPLGLFLLDDPHDGDKVICAHIHFDKRDTSRYSRVNLVHHKRPPVGSTSLLHYEDRDKLSDTALKHNKHKKKVTLDSCTHQLVEACRQFVQKDEMGRWEDVSRWNMTEEDVSVKRKFRMVQERSAWEDNYLKYIEKFNLPKVSDE